MPRNVSDVVKSSISTSNGMQVAISLQILV